MVSNSKKTKKNCYKPLTTRFFKQRTGMKKLSQILFCSAIFISGCATKPSNIAFQSINYHARGIDESMTNSPGWHAANIALEASSRSIPGTIPSGVGIGIISLQLIASTKKFQDLARRSNHFEAWMPITFAKDEDDAQVKMGSIMETAILKAFQPPYQTKIFEYDDVATVGVVSRFRMIRVDGPGCENWSCIASGPIPTSSAYQWVGEMVKIDAPGFSGRECYAYRGLHGIGLSRIKREYEEDGLFSGHWHKFETGLVSDFDYEKLFQRISENLPDWVYFYLAPRGKDNPVDGPALLNKGVKTMIGDQRKS